MTQDEHHSEHLSIQERIRRLEDRLEKLEDQRIEPLERLALTIRVILLTSFAFIVALGLGAKEIIKQLWSGQ